MTSGIRVHAPPRKPLLVFDGDCDFCRRWIVRWRFATGDQVDYVPFQNPEITERFPEIKRASFEEAVHLIEPDGKVSRGAEAVFRSLAQVPHKRWFLWFYQKVPGVAPVTEFAYRFVAEHRRPFSVLTRVFLPRAPSSHALVGSLFLRALGLIYLIAFVSLWTQIIGLVGKNGITPLEQYMQWAEHQLPGLEGLHLLPTLCWFITSDSFLQMQCTAGAMLSIALIFGLVPVPALFCLWLLYLSLTTVCDVFLSFQWDILLLETGFLAIFFAPMRLRLRRDDQPSEMFLWLIRWLLFRLMFESGCVKVLSGDKTWCDLTALNYHYETQPLPTWIGWYAHQLPAGFQKFSVVIMFVIEMAVPFLIFAPRRARLCSCVPLVLFQVLIAVTGNYCFFNLLTLILCLALLDDAALLRLVPKQWRAHFSLSAAERSLTSEQFLPQKPDDDQSLVAAGPHACAFPITDRLTEHSDGARHSASASDQASTE